MATSRSDTARGRPSPPPVGSGDRHNGAVSSTPRRTPPSWVLAVATVAVLLLGWWLARPAQDAGGAPGALATSSVSAPALPSGAPPAGATQGRSGAASTPDSALPAIRESSLPLPARQTLDLVHAGGPFPYSQDGIVFQNRERLLPPEPSGYYHEYTVRQPGASDRGPWRLITGRGGEIFWTADHYSSFHQVQEGR